LPGLGEGRFGTGALFVGDVALEKGLEVTDALAQPFAPVDYPAHRPPLTVP
jgi:hypothetical protein